MVGDVLDVDKNLRPGEKSQGNRESCLDAPSLLGCSYVGDALRVLGLW